MTLNRYIFDDLSYTLLAAAGVDPVDVVRFLHRDGGHLIEHLGTGLLLTGRTPGGTWVTVECLEHNDQYLVSGASLLSDRQIAIVAELLGTEE